MAEIAELGAFLKTRRAALSPALAGIPQGPTRRRVQGLRREELAQLAGISVDYYTRLEQGRARNVSAAVLGALARALDLTPDESDYLHNLAAPKRRRAAPPRRQHVRGQIRLLLDAIDVPAMVFGRNLDVLAWNRLGGALSFDFDSLPERERNVGRLFFLDPAAREFHPEWELVAREIVANLRAEAGRGTDEQGLAQLVGELSLHSKDFRRLWARQTVREKAYGLKIVQNPVVGELELLYETLRLPDDDAQALVTYTAEPGSESARRLRLLASWVAEDDPANAGPRTATPPAVPGRTPVPGRSGSAAPG